MLAELRCTAIDKTMQPLSSIEAQKMLNEIPEWSLRDIMIIREFKFNDFIEAMRFVNKVAELANNEEHHPDIHVSYNKVTLELSTHKIGGLSMNDFILAAKINCI